MTEIQKNNKHKKCIFKIQDYINIHYSEELTLEKLSGIAAFSPYHFHRIFKSIAGETLRKFITRTRLEKACSFLKYSPELRIIDIALACGFETPSSFTKAFKNRYSISPAEYRQGRFLNLDKTGTENSKTGILKSNNSKEKNSYYLYDFQKFKYKRREFMVVKIEQMSKYRVAYMRHIGPYGDSNYELMDQIKKWAFAHDLFNSEPIFVGIAHDDPSVTRPTHCRYDCGIVIPFDFKLEGDINECELPGGNYAVCEVNHTTDEITKAWKELFSTWLPDSGYQIDEKPIFERYKKLNTNEIGTEICIPVKPA